MIERAAPPHQSAAARDKSLDFAENHRSRRLPASDVEGERPAALRPANEFAPRSDLMNQGGMRNGSSTPRLPAGA